MIVVDASIVAPLVLPDERPLPDGVAAELSAGTLVAPAHWPSEVGNMLLSAHRRGRLERLRMEAALDDLAKLGVVPTPPPGLGVVRTIAALAERHRLTLYDAAYLHEALVRGARLATLDTALIAAARSADVPVLTYA